MLQRFFYYLDLLGSRECKNISRKGARKAKEQRKMTTNTILCLFA